MFIKLETNKGPNAAFWNAKQKEFLYKQLDKESVLKEMDALRNLGDLENNYSLSNRTDQPTQVLTLRLGNELKKISIYGDFRKQKEVREKVPELLLSKYDHFIFYSTSGAKSWKPKYLEVMI